MALTDAGDAGAKDVSAPVAVSKAAMRLRVVEPTLVNSPPTYSVLPSGWRPGCRPAR